MAFNFPNAPSPGDVFQPSGGPSFRYSGSVWTVLSPPFQGAFPSDTAPLNPVNGQLWWETDTGLLYVFFVDISGPPGQWVEVVSSSMPDPPADGNEYVRVNGAWRLKSQTYDLTGKTQQDVFAPSWGPTQLRIVSFLYANNVALNPSLQMSADGSTFVGTAAAYTYGGFYHATGSAGYQHVSMASASYWPLSIASDNVDIPHTLDATINLQRSVSGLIAIRTKCSSYHSNVLYGFVETSYEGYLQDGLTSGLYKGVRLNLNTGVMSGKLVVEWLA